MSKRLTLSDNELYVLREVLNFAIKEHRYSANHIAGRLGIWELTVVLKRFNEEGKNNEQ